MRNLQNPSKSGSLPNSCALHEQDNLMYVCVCAFISVNSAFVFWPDLSVFKGWGWQMLLFSTEDCELEAGYFSCLGNGRMPSVYWDLAQSAQSLSKKTLEWECPVGHSNHARVPSLYCDFARSAQSPSHGGLETCYSSAGTCLYAECLLSCSHSGFSLEPMRGHHECHPWHEGFPSDFSCRRLSIPQQILWRSAKTGAALWQRYCPPQVQERTNFLWRMIMLGNLFRGRLKDLRSALLPYK